MQELAAQLQASKMGVVAHFYMDPEVCQKTTAGLGMSLRRVEFERQQAA